MMSPGRSRRRRRLRKACLYAAGLVLIICAVWLLRRTQQSVETAQTAAVRNSVETAAAECYALEGSYPPSLAYLQRNYGLVLDTKHYFYRYQIFAVNLPPNVFVFRKE